jgi:hypothetical protein
MNICLSTTSPGTLALLGLRLRRYDLSRRTAWVETGGDELIPKFLCIERNLDSMPRSLKIPIDLVCKSFVVLPHSLWSTILVSNYKQFTVALHNVELGSAVFPSIFQLVNSNTDGVGALLQKTPQVLGIMYWIDRFVRVCTFAIGSAWIVCNLVSRTISLHESRKDVELLLFSLLNRQVIDDLVEGDLSTLVLEISFSDCHLRQKFVLASWLSFSLDLYGGQGAGRPFALLACGS